MRDSPSSQPPDARELHVAILGAGGIIAPAIVRDLAESEEASRLLLLDLDADRAQAVADAHGGSKSVVSQVDARAGLADSLDGIDVLVNSASYRVNLSAMRACLEAGCHYIDLGGLYHVTAKQLDLSHQFEADSLLALLGMGSSPGKTNVMAAHAVAELGADPTRVDVFAASRDPAPPAGESYPYSPRTLADELTMAPIATRFGVAETLEPMQDGGTVDFPAPIGPAETIYTLHSEVLTFPRSFNLSECSFRLALPPAVLDRVRALIEEGEEAVNLAAARSRPASSSTVSFHMIEASTNDAQARVTATTRPMQEWGLGGGIVSTAAPAAAAVRLLARGAIEARGAVPPERCVRPEDLFPELERRNCSFNTEVNAIR